MKLPTFDKRKHFYSQTARLYQMVGLYQIRQDSQLSRQSFRHQHYHHLAD